MFVSHFNMARMPREVIFQVAKGIAGRSKGCIRLARVRAMLRMQNSYIRRHKRGTQFRTNWIMRVSNAVREYQKLTYSSFKNVLLRENIQLDRKMLCALAETEPVSFKCLVDEAKRLHNYPETKHRDIKDY
eukprot:Platyproteum_vivax@DN8058_c0_g1_i1.p1